jgi:hypothetical protein
VSWRDREWARFTDEERRLLYGGGRSGCRSHGNPLAQPVTPGRLAWAAVGVLALVVSLFSLYAHRRAKLVAPAPPVSPVVYGGATGQVGRDRVACTAESANIRINAWVCTEWTILQPGQLVAPARSRGGPCGVRHVDQPTGQWVCDALTPPNPDLLPSPPGQAAPTA